MPHVGVNGNRLLRTFFLALFVSWGGGGGGQERYLMVLHSLVLARYDVLNREFFHFLLFVEVDEICR